MTDKEILARAKEQGVSDQALTEIQKTLDKIDYTLDLLMEFPIDKL